MANKKVYKYDGTRSHDSLVAFATGGYLKQSGQSLPVILMFFLNLFVLLLLIEIWKLNIDCFERWTNHWRNKANSKRKECSFAASKSIVLKLNLLIIYFKKYIYIRNELFQKHLYYWMMKILFWKLRKNLGYYYCKHSKFIFKKKKKINDDN